MSESVSQWVSQIIEYRAAASQLKIQFYNTYVWQIICQLYNSSKKENGAGFARSRAWEMWRKGSKIMACEVNLWHGMEKFDKKIKN